MDGTRLRALLGGALWLLVATPLGAQVRVDVQGRVEDAATRQPIPGARITAADSSAAVFADSLGRFRIALPSGGLLAVQAEGLGYESQRFVLGVRAPSHPFVLLLEPAPVVLEGVTVVSEEAITVLQQNLERRRNGYPHAMRAFDRAWIDRFGGIGTAYDLVRRGIPRMVPCDEDPGGICVPGRFRTIRDPYPLEQYSVCIDGWRSISATDELEMLPIESVALVELFHGAGKQVRVYTSQWVLFRARNGLTSIPPLWMGC